MTDAELIGKLDQMAKHIFGLDSGSGDAVVIQAASLRIRELQSCQTKGCMCPSGANKECRNPFCPRQSPFMIG